MNRCYIPPPGTKLPWTWRIQPYLPEFAQDHLRRYDLYRWPRRAREWLKYLLVRPREEKRFFIVSCEYNAREMAIKCLDSVYAQKYNPSRVRHLLIDDASTDGTHELIVDWLSRHPDHRVEYIRNLERRGVAPNTYGGFRQARPGEIVAELNGDDWLPDPGVLRFLNKAYADPAVWLTYNTFRFFLGGRLRETFLAYPAPVEVIANNGFRIYNLFSFHALRTFRYELFKQLREEDLLDPLTGEPWKYASDMAYFLPLLEMAAYHGRHLHRVTYIYNINKRSFASDPNTEPRKTDIRIRALPPRQPLPSLELPEVHEKADDGPQP